MTLQWFCTKSCCIKAYTLLQICSHRIYASLGELKGGYLGGVGCVSGGSKEVARAGSVESLQPVWGILILRPDTDCAALHCTDREAQIGNQHFQG